MRVQLLRPLLLLLALTCSLIPALAYAQFGEVAGQLYTNVSLGSSNSVSFTLVNGGSTPIKFEIVPPPTFRSSTPNTIAPTVTAHPSNGTIAPDSEFAINVTVYVPAAKNNTPGTQWVGVIQAIVVTNGSSSLTGSGANIQEGVAKIITITAAKQQPSILPYVAAVAIAIIAVGGGALYMRRQRKPARAARPARAAAQVRGKRAARKGVSKARRSARRRTVAKARKSASRARRPRRRR